MQELVNNPLGISVALLFILETFNLLVRVGENVRKLRKPAQTVDDRLAEHDSKLKNDNDRLNDLAAGQAVTIKGMRALLWHQRTGNSIDKLEKAAEEIDKYLTER
ncbi:MAG: hypothetical protein RSE23_01900 [Clostridia bacterium]